MRGRATLQTIATFDALLNELRRSVDAADVVVVPARDERGESAEGLVRQIVAARPRAAIVAYCAPTQQYSADIRALTAAGVHQFVLTGISDEGSALREALVSARRHSAAEWLARRCATVIPSRLHLMIEAVFAHPERVTSIPQLAAELHVHRKTLFNWCERAGSLGPAELVAWCRLAVVAYHLENTGCTVETIAIELSYPSVTSLRNTVKRYTGLTATEIRRRGAVDAVLGALQERIAGRG